MPKLELLHARTFDAEMNRLRCECFAGQYPSGDAKDRFDDRSVHVITCVDGRLAGYGRLTPGPDSWFEFLSGGVAGLPVGPDVVDFGRVAVAPTFRGHDHFELILLEGLLWACDEGFRVVVGSSRPNRKFRSFLHELGFSDCGPVLSFTVGDGWVEPDQPVVAVTAANRPRWSARKLQVLARLQKNGNEVIRHGCRV